MKNKSILLSLWCFVALNIFISCEDEVVAKIKYEAIPKTAIGEKLVENTDLFASINKDTTYTVVDGLKATEIDYLSMKGVAMHIFIFEVDLANSNLSLEASTPENKSSFGRQVMTEQATYEDLAGHRVWGGINGDFFNMNSGVPQGILYKEGVCIKNTFADAVCTYFAFTKDGKGLVAGQDVYNDVKSTIQEAIGGRVWLVKDGITVPQSDTRTEPRTCIGVTASRDTVYMLAVDGRNFTYSNGMSYDELSQCMSALGAENAINLDGGGSTTFFIRNTPEFNEDRFEIRNWPSDYGGQERTVANGILIISND